MALKDALENLRKVEQEIVQLIEEEQIRKDNPISYVFVYEQKYKDADGWGYNDQIIEAWDEEEAFRTFGWTLREHKLIVRNINYGLEGEMQEELDRIRAWRDQEFGKGKQ